MNSLRLPAMLEESSRILIAGAGGGFDVYAGLPVYERLRSLGKTVYLANLSFTSLGMTDAAMLTPALFQVNPRTHGEDGYFPERTLARFLSRSGEETSVYAFDRVGAEPIWNSYEFLVNSLNLDAIILIDGGTDILLRGDETSLGTPAEDMVSLAAVAALDVPTRLVMCVGFGIDTFHGVCHANWLENVAAISAAGGFLGSISLIEQMPEAQSYIAAVNDAQRETPLRPSIVNGSIASAIQGRFGDQHGSARTERSKLFISPLMSLLWAFDLPTVARQNLYLGLLAKTQTMREVELAIEGFHASVVTRPRMPIPH